MNPDDLAHVGGSRQVESTARTDDAVALRPVRQVAAHELVLDQIRKSLQLGRFGPGDRLPNVGQLAEILNVSRSTVRAAAAILEREGLLDVRRGRGGGLFVRGPQEGGSVDLKLLQDRESMLVTFEWRGIVESSAARLAAERRTDDQLERLTWLASRMDGVIGGGIEDDVDQVIEFQRLDTDFHLLIGAASGNAYLEAAVQDARRIMWHPAGALFDRLAPTANDRHAEILEAIRTRNADQAEEMMRAHVEATRDVLDAWLRRING